MSQQNSEPKSGPETDSERKMPFFSHLDELRGRLVRAAMVFMAGFAGCYLISDQLMGFLRRPLFQVLPPDQQKLYFTSLFENFMTHLKISGYGSLVFLSPYFFYEIWGFIAPGLYPRERKLVVPFVSVASLFFIGGAAFAYFILFPVGFKFFVHYGVVSDVPLLTIDSYYATCLKLLLLFGIAFELPVLITLLGYIGVVDAAMLKAHRKTAMIAISILAAFFAPPDAVSMLILIAPLALMYEGSIHVVSWLVRKKKEEAARTAAEPPSNPLEGRSKP